MFILLPILPLLELCRAGRPHPTPPTRPEEYISYRVLISSVLLTITVTSHNYDVLWFITHLIALECGRIARNFTHSRFYFEKN